jgi:uncharacterized membrane protein (UPF0127 family)
MAKQLTLEPVWLVSKGIVLCAAMKATSRADRRRGLLGVSHVTEPLVLQPCTWVHSFGMRTAIDVAYVGSDGVVLATSHLKPWRIGPIMRSADFVIEAAPGSFERWNLHRGDEVEIRHANG